MKSAYLEPLGFEKTNFRVVRKFHLAHVHTTRSLCPLLNPVSRVRGRDNSRYTEPSYADVCDLNSFPFGCGRRIQSIETSGCPVKMPYFCSMSAVWPGQGQVYTTDCVLGLPSLSDSEHAHNNLVGNAKACGNYLLRSRRILHSFDTNFL